MRCPFTPSAGNTLFVVSWVMGTANRVKGRAVVILSVDATHLLMAKGQWLQAIHRVAPKAPENFVPFAGDPRECRGKVGLGGMPCTQCARVLSFECRPILRPYF